MSENNSRTRQFEPISDNSNDPRRKVVIAIFIVVALILAAFATLIVGKLVAQLPDKPNTPINREVTYFPKEAEDKRIGYLLSVSDAFPYGERTDFSDLVDVYTYRHNADNHGVTRIDGKKTYSLSRSDIVLETNTLNAFNQMMLDYCKTIDTSSASDESASNIILSWAGYSSKTINEYREDLASPKLGKEYYDHILGTSLTLSVYEPTTAITESILKQNYSWIYDNAHKYGFIIRYPDACKDHTGFDSTKRVHLRYVGVEHATYIYANGICLEKYLEILRNQHNSVDKPLAITTAGKTYEVYYVKYNGNPTKIPVPKDAVYTISGDNMNGFIVTVEK